MLQALAQPQVLAFLGAVLVIAVFALGIHGLFVVSLASVLFYLGFYLFAEIELTSTNGMIGFIAVIIAIELLDRLLSSVSPAGANLIDTLGYWAGLLLGLLLVAAIISYAMGYEPVFLNNLIGV